MPLPVTDPRDIRVMTPRVRRAVDGPFTSSSGAISATLTDDQVKDLTADACANIALYTSGVFGHSLTATAIDPTYGAPTEYVVDPVLGLDEQTVIVADAALTYFFHEFRDKKVMEHVQNEQTTWEYQLSANLLAAQIKLLQDTRDKALDSLYNIRTSGIDQWRSFVAVRDQTTSMALEPWVDPQGYDAPYWMDMRFPWF